jgi:hypothetical protein
VTGELLDIAQAAAIFEYQPRRVRDEGATPRMRRAAAQPELSVGPAKQVTTLLGRKPSDRPRPELMMAPSPPVLRRSTNKARRSSGCSGMARPLPFLAALSCRSKRWPSPAAPALLAFLDRPSGQGVHEPLGGYQMMPPSTSSETMASQHRQSAIENGDWRGPYRSEASVAMDDR